MFLVWVPYLLFLLALLQLWSIRSFVPVQLFRNTFMCIWFPSQLNFDLSLVAIFTARCGLFVLFLIGNHIFVLFWNISSGGRRDASASWIRTAGLRIFQFQGGYPCPAAIKTVAWIYFDQPSSQSKPSVSPHAGLSAKRRHIIVWTCKTPSLG